VDSSFTTQNSKSSLHSLCLSAHFLDALLAEYLPQNVQQFCPFLLCTMHLLNALLAELLRILSDSGLLNSQQSSFSVHSLHLCSMPTWQSSTESSEILSLQTLNRVLPPAPVLMLNAHLAELYRILSDSVCNCVSATQPCLQGIQQP
jgi:hypothetical protein